MKRIFVFAINIRIINNALNVNDGIDREIYYLKKYAKHIASFKDYL